MLLKIVALFLIFMLVMAMLQKWLGGARRLPGAGRRSAIDALRCPVCRQIRIADRPGPCGRLDCEYR